MIDYEPVAEGFLCESERISDIVLRLSGKAVIRERADFVSRVFFAQKQLNKNLIHVNRKVDAFKENIKAVGKMLEKEEHMINGERL